MIDIAMALVIPIMVFYCLTLPKVRVLPEEPYTMDQFRKDIHILTIDDLLDKCDRLGLPWKAIPVVTPVEPVIVGAWSSASTSVFQHTNGTITITNNSPMTLTEITVSAMSTGCTSNANFASYDMTGYTFEYGERREI